MVKGITVSPECRNKIPRDEIAVMCDSIANRHSGSSERHVHEFKRYGEIVVIVYQNGYMSVSFNGEI